jgi:hypothetical protein
MSYESEYMSLVRICTVPQTKQGLQSLGKVGTGSRRMPAPTLLPSLKSEHDKGSYSELYRYNYFIHLYALTALYEMFVYEGASGDSKESQPQVSSERKVAQVNAVAVSQVSRSGTQSSTSISLVYNW